MQARTRRSRLATHSDIPYAVRHYACYPYVLQDDGGKCDLSSSNDYSEQWYKLYALTGIIHMQLQC
jgi:hypothetical protein